MANGSTGGAVSPIDPAMIAKIMTPRNSLADAYRDLNRRLIAEQQAHLATKLQLDRALSDLKFTTPDTSAPLWGKKESE